MNFLLVYKKTAKGVAEVSHSHGAHSGVLSPAALRILVMIDGKRSAAELELVTREGEFEGIIAELQAHGMIEGPKGAVSAPKTPELTTAGLTSPLVAAETQKLPPDRRASNEDSFADAPAPQEINGSSAAEPAHPSLEEIKRIAMRELYDRLGPYGEEPAARIQGCKTRDALRYAVQEASRRIAFMRDQKAAQEYLQKTGQV